MKNTDKTVSRKASGAAAETIKDKESTSGKALGTSGKALGTSGRALGTSLSRALGISLVFVMLLVMLFAASSEAVFAEPKSAEETGAGTSGTAASGVEGGAFEVTDYVLRAEVKKDHSYVASETIRVNIPDRLQRIDFAIPSGNFRLSDLTVENTAYAAKKASEASTVSIVDPDKLTKGTHEYTIKYTIREYDDRDSSKDMFYYNVLLPEWKQPIGRVDIKVSFPEDFQWDDMQCYAGQFGVQDVTNRIRFTADQDSDSVIITGRLIPENFGITLKAQLTEGYWQGALSGNWSLGAIIVSIGGALALLLILWLIGGRDPKVKKEIVTKPVEGVSPVELGYIFNSAVDIRDILHMLLHFAEKGYLRISEYEPKRYRLYKLKDPAGEERMYRNAYNILFDGIYTGRAVEMEDLGPRLERVRKSISDDVASGFASGEASAFTPLSKTFRAAGSLILGAGLGLANAFSYIYSFQQVNYAESVIAGAAAAAAALLLCRKIDTRDSSPVRAGRVAELLSGIIFAVPALYVAGRVLRNTREPFISVLLIIAAGASAFLIVIMRARGRENAELVSRLRSLRSFIYHPTPKELLENHLADPDYYYEMLIYALAFAGEESWAISFLTLDVPEPEWYTDEIEGHAFTNLRDELTTIDYARDLKTFIRTIENSYKGKTNGR